MKWFIISILMLCGGTAGYLYHSEYGGPEITLWQAITLMVAGAGSGLLWAEFTWRRLPRKAAK